MHCSSIVKYIYIFIFFFKLVFPEISLSSLSLFLLSSLSSFSLSHLLFPLFRPRHHSLPNINITHHSGGNIGGNVDAVIDTSGFHKKNIYIYIYIYIYIFPVVMLWFSPIGVDQWWRKCWSSGDNGGGAWVLIGVDFFFFLGDFHRSGLIWVDQWWRKRWSSGGSGGSVWVFIGVDLCIFFLNFFFLLWSRLTGDVWVFVPVGFWWAMVVWWTWWRRNGGGD